MRPLPNNWRNTIGSEQWMRENESKIKSLLPQVWTHAENLAGRQIITLAYKFKLLGIEWKSFDEFGLIMSYLEEIGILLHQNGYQVKANPHSIFAR